MAVAFSRDKSQRFKNNQASSLGPGTYASNNALAGKAKGPVGNSSKPVVTRKAGLPAGKPKLSAPVQPEYELLSRRATVNDAPAILELVVAEEQLYLQRFGTLDLSYLIETSVLSIVVEADNKIVGFATFFDAPPEPFSFDSPEISQENWPDWFSNQYRRVEYGVHNSLWLTFFAAAPLFTQQVANHILHAVFSTIDDLDVILVLMPKPLSSAPPFSPVAEMFELLQPQPDAALSARSKQQQSTNEFSTWFCSRTLFIPTLNVRLANIEDHDDLVPIFEEQSQVLTDTFGEFFLARQIENQDPTNLSLVAELDGKAVGIMSVTNTIDVQLLKQCFQLGPYDGLNRADLEPEPKEQSAEDQSGADADKDADDEDGEEPSVEDRLVRIFQAIAAATAKETGEQMGSGLIVFEALAKRIRAFIASLEADVAAGSSTITPDYPLACQMAFQSASATASEILELDEFTAVLSALESQLPEPWKSSLPVLRYLEMELIIKPRREAAAAEAAAKAAEEAARLAAEAEASGVTAAQAAAEKARKEAEEFAAAERARALIDTSADNVFAVTMFCLAPAYEKRAVDFLQPMFQVFPDRNFCVLTAPHLAPESPIQSYFTRVAPLPGSTFAHSMYLLNSAAVQPQIVVRRAVPADLPAMLQLTAGMSSASSIQEQLRRALAPGNSSLGVSPPSILDNAPVNKSAFPGTPERSNKSPSSSSPAAASPVAEPRKLAAFVALCDDQIIGVVVASPLDDKKVLRIRKSFAVNKFIDCRVILPRTASQPVPPPQEGFFLPLHQDEIEPVHGETPHALLHYCILNPLFAAQARRFYREVMRLFRKSVLYHRVAGAQTPLQSEIFDIFVQVPPVDETVQIAVPAAPMPLPDELDDVSAYTNRRSKQAVLAEQREQQLAEQMAFQKERRYALHILTRRILSQPKFNINARIVVIGASDVGLSLLENLLLRPQFNYASLTVISAGGLPFHTATTDDDSANSQPHSLHFEGDRPTKLGLQARVRVMASTVLDFDCNTKTVTVQVPQVTAPLPGAPASSAKAVVPYDFLVLCPGMQDQLPNTLGAGIDGIFTLNTRDNYNKMVKYLRKFPGPARNAHMAVGSHGRDPTSSLQPASPSSHDATNIVVYGRTLQAMSSLAAVMRFMHDSEFVHLAIIWIHDGPEDDMSWCNNDTTVGERVYAAMAQAKVRIVHSSTIASIQQTRGRVSSVTLAPPQAAFQPSRSHVPTGAFLSSHAPPLVRNVSDAPAPASAAAEVISCQVMVSCHAMDIDSHIFAAVTRNGLVYDGKLVVGGDFSTVDSCVFAAGTCAKFSRKLGVARARSAAATATRDVDDIGALFSGTTASVPPAPAVSAVTEQSAFDSKEIAEQLAKTLLRRVDPVDGDAATPKPDYSQALGKAPKAVHAVLPGNLRYFFAQTLQMPNTSEPPLVLTTENKATTRYTRLEFAGKTRTLRSFTCVWPIGSTSGHARGLASAPSPVKQAKGGDKAAPSSSSSSVVVASGEQSSAPELSVTRWLPSFVRLIGLPASFMNRIVERHAANSIPDFIDFLQAPWATALYDEGFADLRASIVQKLRAVLTAQGGQKAEADNLQALVSRLTSNDEQSPTNAASPQLAASLKIDVQTRVLSFLDANSALLPNYQIPKNTRPIVTQ